MSEQPKSPIKDKPLRTPGQSLEEERRKLFEDKVETPLLLVVFFTAFTALEWWRYFWNKPLNPIVFTVATVLVASFLVASFAAWRIWKTRPQVRALRQGIEGEKAVGQGIAQVLGKRTSEIGTRRGQTRQFPLVSLYS